MIERMEKVIVFGGHMVDLPGRPEPRFPPQMEGAAAAAIGDALDNLLGDRSGSVLALSSAARGGDILFLEACRKRGIPVHIVLPFPSEEFLETSVRGARGGDWEARFRELWDATPATHRTVLTVAGGDNPYAACNRHLVARAGEHGGTLAMIALWDGRSGDGAGGTDGLIDLVRQAGGSVRRIDSTELLKTIRRF
jgi:hypothetical protein